MHPPERNVRKLPQSGGSENGGFLKSASEGRTVPSVQVEPARSLVDAVVAARWRAVEIALALVVAVLIGSRYMVFRQLTIGYFVAFLLIPLWWGLTRRLVTPRVLGVLAGVGVLTGWLMQWIHTPDHAVESTLAVIVSVELIGVFCAAATLWWAIRTAGLGWTMVSFGVGMLAFVDTSGARFASGPWRFGFALPVTVIVMGLAVIIGKRWLEVVLLVLLCVPTVLAGSRSLSAILLLALVMIAVGWARGGRLRKRTSVLVTAGVVGALTAVILSLGQALLLEGYLGQEAQERTEWQVDAAGSVLLGGRPELGATLALIARQPFGMGPGVRPNWDEMQTARSGMAGLGYDPNSGYVDNYMFGDGFRLHSVFGDLWANFGIAGLLIAIVLLWFCLKVLSLGTRGVGDGITFIVTFQTLWDLPFSPWYSSITSLMVVLAIGWDRLLKSGVPPGDPA